MKDMDAEGSDRCDRSTSRLDREVVPSWFCRLDMFGDDRARALSPLVANILMVAVVLVLAMLVTVLAFGILSDVDTDQPVTSFEVERGADGQLWIVHTNGDPLTPARLSLTFADRTYSGSGYVGVDQITSGTKLGPIYPAGAEDVTLIWEKQETSALLYTADVDEESSTPGYVRFDDRPVGSYGVGQDANGAFRWTNGSRTLVLENNSWKYVPFDPKLTANSVLAFDFRSTDEGEIHGIGLEDDTSPSSDRIFQLFGTQNSWASQYESYATTDGWVRYEIPVGELYTASELDSTSHLAFVNDLDDGGETSDSWFRNVRVYETDTDTPELDVTIERTTEKLPVNSYGSQDKDGTYELQDGNETIALTNNTWRYVPLDVSVTAQTTVSFEFKSNSLGEIHAIGFETDASEDQSRFVTLNGSQNWGTEYGTYQTGDGWIEYEFTIEDRTTATLAGTDISRIVFVNDDDDDASGNSLFRNVTVSKTG